jgi:hypothetical protein
MDQMILCAMAMVALRWWTSVAPWRMAKNREYRLVTNEGPLTSAQGPALSKVQNGRVRHMIRQMIQTGSMVLLLVPTLYPGAAAAHEGTDLEEDPCVRRVGESAVHFNAYQPQYELKAQYCTDIPKTGETFLVVDLVDPALRNMPVGLRIVKGNGSNEAEAQTVADWRPSHHPAGVVSGETTLDEGLYRVIITAEGRNPLRYQYLLRVQMIDYQKLVRSVVTPLIGLLLITWLTYKLIKSRRTLRNWWIALRS